MWLRFWLRQLFSGTWSARPLGLRGEELAARYLRKLGYRIVARGHRNAFGEIDLIALDGQIVVFVEVKTRQSTSHGLPSDAVDFDKQRRLTRAALGYLKQRRWLDRSSRFDVISVVWSEGSESPEITHFRHAFEATDRGQFYS